MELKKTGLIYWAEPIDFVDPNNFLSDDDLDRADFADKLRRELMNTGWVTYNPRNAFDVGDNAPGPLVSVINEVALDQANALVAFLPQNVQTYGVPAEIEQFVVTGKPVLIVTDASSRSWTIAGWAKNRNVRLLAFNEDSSLAASWLNDFDAGHESRTSGVSSIVFQQHSDTATLPTKGYSDDAGYDLYASEPVVVPARGQATIPLGVSVDVPEGMWAQITGRSSTLKNLNLMVAPTVGVIDEGYTGELFAPVVSIADEDVTIDKGQRIAQLILHVAPGQRFTPAWGTTRDKARGTNGFGSTGR